PNKVKPGNIVHGKDGFAKVTSVSGKVITEEISISKKDTEAVKSFIGIRDVFNELITNEVIGEKDEVLTPLRKKLKAKYDEFVKKHGPLNQFRKIIEEDIDGFNILGLEKLNDKKEVAGLADIFEKRTIKPYVRPDTAESPQDAIFISMNE